MIWTSENKTIEATALGNLRNTIQNHYKVNKGGGVFSEYKDITAKHSMINEFVVCVLLLCLLFT